MKLSQWVCFISGVILLGMIVVFPPWIRMHPSDVSLRERMGFAFIGRVRADQNWQYDIDVKEYSGEIIAIVVASVAAVVVLRAAGEG